MRRDVSGRRSRKRLHPKPGQLLVEVRASMVSPGTELGGVKRRRENPGSEARQRSFGYTNAGVVVGMEGDCDEFENWR